MADIYDLVIIGSGPAGLSAAIYAGRSRLKVCVVESFAFPSQISLTAEVENYPGFPQGASGLQLLQNFRQQAERFGAEFSAAEIVSLEKKEDFWRLADASGKEYKALAVIIASGASARKLGIEGEREFTGKGVSYCATCDGAFFRNQIVAVIGGGDTAVEEALFLTRFAKEVKIIHRRDRLRATKILQEKAFAHPKIELVLNSLPQAIIGKEKVEGVKVKDKQTQAEKIVECQGVFIFVGNSPNTAFAKGVVEQDEFGYIKVDSYMQTTQKGIFACGDCCRKLLRQVVTACGDGATAAYAAQKYLEDLKGIAYN